MASYRFLGTMMEIPDLSMLVQRFGEKVELDKDVAENAVLIGAQMIPEDQFSALGFTDKELEENASSAAHDSAPDEFKKKKFKALTALHDFRQTVRAEKGV